MTPYSGSTSTSQKIVFKRMAPHSALQRGKSANDMIDEQDASASAISYSGDNKLLNTTGQG